MIRTTIVIASLGLTACSGGSEVTSIGPGGGGGLQNAEPVFTFQDSTSDGVSRIAGQAVITTGLVIRPVTGSLAHQTRNLTNLTDGVTTFSDLSGDNNGVWTDGTNSFGPSSVQAGVYEYSAIYNLTSAANGSGPTVAGVATPTSYLNVGGTLSFKGEAFIEGATLGAGSIQSTGASTVTVNLGTNTANVVMSGITGAPPFDTVQINGLSLDRATSTLTGGAVTLHAGATTVTGSVMGSSITSDAAATLFGLNDAKNAPDEAGGVFSLKGSDGTISGGFLGD